MSVVAPSVRPAPAVRRISVTSSLPWLLGLLFFAIGAGFAVGQHLTFHTRARDMGIYVQILWNAAQGRPFVSTLLQENTNHLAEHVAPALWPLVPLAGLVPSAVPLLVVQSAFLAACGFPIYLWARSRLGPRLALAPLLGFYLMPALSRVSLSEFHPIKLAALPVAAGAALLLTRRPRSAALCLLLALLFEEETAPTVGGLAVLMALLNLRPGSVALERGSAEARERGALEASGAGAGAPPTASARAAASSPTPPRSRAAALALALAALAALWLLLAVAVVMPAFRLPVGRGEGGNRTLAHYETLQRDPSIVWPWITAERGPDALAWLLLPGGGLALLAPELLAALGPDFLLLFLQDREGTYAGHWAAPLLPLSWLAVALGLTRLGRWPRLQRVGLVALAAGTAIAYPLDSYFPGGREYEADHYQMTEVEADLARAVEQVPPGASLVATRRVVPHLAARRDLYQFPFSFYNAPLRPDSQRQEFYVLDLTDSPTRRAVEPSESDSVLEKRPRYHLQRLGPEVLVLSRTRPLPEQPLDVTFAGTVGLLGLTWPDGPPAGWSARGLTVELYWTALRRPETEPTRVLRLLGPNGEIVSELTGQVVDSYLPVRDWDRGQVVAEQATVHPPSHVTGAHRLVVGWHGADGRPLAIDDSGASELELARFEWR